MEYQGNMSQAKICALVVTYNRKELVVECLDAIKDQSHPVDIILIIDNFSSLDALEHIKKHGYLIDYSSDFIENGGELKIDTVTAQNNKIKVIYKRLPENTGGAGGFNAGMRYFIEQTDCEYLWLMDDDTKPDKEALSKLMEAYDYFFMRSLSVGFIASRVKWLDGSPCKIANPLIKPVVGLGEYSPKTPFLEIESAAFVSLLFSQAVIKKVGLPLREYFIWNDDVEYTNRVNKYYRNFVALDSVVWHQTKNNAASDEQITSNNFFKHKFGIRNKISWLRRDKGLLRAIFFSIYFMRLIFKANLTFAQKIRLFVSIIQGWFFNPKIEFLNRNSHILD